MRKIYAALIICNICLPLSAFAGDPIPGIDITVDQSPPGVSFSGTTNAAGEVSLTGLVAGSYIVTLKDEVGSVVLGTGRDDAIIVESGSRGATVKPIRLELSRYQDGEDLVLRKRPGGRSSVTASAPSRNQTVGTAVTISSDTSRATDYNSSRSNKSYSRATGAGLRDDADNDCDGVVGIVAAADGSMKITVSCAD